MGSFTNAFTGINVQSGTTPTVVISGVSATTPVTFSGSTASGNVTLLTSAAGATASAPVINLGTASLSGITVNALVLGDSASTPIPISTVTIVSNGTGGVNNTITLNPTTVTTLRQTTSVDGINNLVVSGAAGLNVTIAQDVATTFTANNTTTANILSTVSLNDQYLNSVTFTGTAIEQITNATASTATSLTVSNTSTASNVYTNSATTGANLASIVISGSAGLTVNQVSTTTGTLTINDSMSAANTLNLSASSTTAPVINLSNSGNGALTLGTFSDSGLTSLTLQNTGTGALTGTSVTSTASNGLTTLNFNGSGPITATSVTTGTLAATGVFASTDSGAVTLTSITTVSGNNSQGLQFTNSGNGAYTITNLVGSGTSTGILAFSDSGAGNLTLTGTTSIDTHASIQLTNTGTGTLVVGAATSTPFIDDLATTITGTGSGAITIRIDDELAGVVTSNFNGLIGTAATGAVTEWITRGAAVGNNDVYTFGSSLINLTISGSTGNTLSGTSPITLNNSNANVITLGASHTNPDQFTFTTPSGTSSVTTFTTIVNAVDNKDTLTFRNSGSSTNQTLVAGTVAGTKGGTFASVQAGVNYELAYLTSTQVGWFIAPNSSGVNSVYIFDHQSASTTALAASDNLVLLSGLATIPSFAVASNVITI